MHEPLISVIVPVYRVEKYLKQCVDSILAQSHRNLEVLLIDDGSPDACPAICDAYAEADSRVRVIHQENQGLSAARNAGLDACRGEYIGFADSDDWMEPELLASLLRMLQEKNLDVAFCAAQIERGTQERELRFLYFPDGTVRTSAEMVRDTLTDTIGGQVWLRLSKRKCWEHVRFPVGRFYEDLAISYQPFLYADRGTGFLMKPLYHYRLNPQGISFSHNPKCTYDIFLGFREHYVYAKAHCEAAAEVCFAKTASFAMGYFNACVRCGAPGDPASLADAEQWLRAHKREIRKCRQLSLGRKIMITLFLTSKALYRTLSSIYLTFQKEQNKLS